eukprot:CAMPEP_0178436734 /NCGR_PEP_ID=MMETSP0689_2-20121128/34594_1 /TAXON_ID=160604 /ORGANISM="Amphidinium massartii, Strain CS-259" /LENGTH=111 /DNA_ID=CAMNT_0020058843 /DNA_START=109 /DNA_END=444 /DNA_ORIENTATION=-
MSNRSLVLRRFVQVGLHLAILANYQGDTLSIDEVDHDLNTSINNTLDMVLKALMLHRNSGIPIEDILTELIQAVQRLRELDPFEFQRSRRIQQFGAQPVGIVMQSPAIVLN